MAGPTMRCCAIVFCLAAVATFPSEAVAAKVIAIEEFWELSVGGPESPRCAPQVSMVMSPEDHLDNDWFVFTLNHGTFPNFVAGGVQLQRWRNNDVLATADSQRTDVLAYEGETVRWTQRMTLHDGVLSVRIKDGTSQTWGTFGHGSSLRLSTPTNLTSLNGYRPAVSIEESGITYAGNRVSSLVLLKLRWFTDDGQSHELVAPIDIDTDLDP